MESQEYLSTSVLLSTFQYSTVLKRFEDEFQLLNPRTYKGGGGGVDAPPQ